MSVATEAPLTGEDRENFRWILQQIEAAQTDEELKAVSIDIMCDQYEREVWTRSKARMSIVRSRYKSRHERIKNAP